MNTVNNQNRRPSNTLIEEIIFKYFPFWPLFVVLAILFLIGSRFYLKTTQPVYEATATILLSDQMKGTDLNQVSEALNLPTTKNIVENELEVLHSRRLMDQIVTDLKLYASIYKHGQFKDSIPCYAESPVHIEMRDPTQIKLTRKIPFTFNNANSTVTINNASYPLNQFVSTPYGELRFINNPGGLVVDKQVYYFTLLPMKIITNGNLKALEATASGKVATIVRVKMLDQEPKRAEDILNNLLQKYTQSSIDYKNQLAKNTIAFIDERLNILTHNIKDVERQVQSYKSSNGIINLDDQGKLYMQNVSANDQRLSDINLQLSALNQVEKYVGSKDNSQGIAPSSLGVNDPTLTKLLDRMAEQQAQYDKLKRTTAENNPMLQSVAKQIETLRPSIMENIQNQKATLQMGRSTVNKTLNSYNSVLQSIPQKEKGLIDVTRDQTVKNNTYSFLLGKREQAALAYSSAVPDSRVVDAAESSTLPVAPKKSLIYLIALGAAAVVTLLIILFKELFNNKLLFRKEIEAVTDNPVAGEISYYKEFKDSIDNTNENTQLNRQFSKIIAASGVISSKSVSKLLVTSGVEGEGKSFFALHLAQFLADSGNKVLLVDCDFNSCTISKWNKSESVPGLSNLLAGEENYSNLIKTTNNANINLLSSGSNNIGIRLLSNGKLEKFISTESIKYDFIIFDSSALEVDGQADSVAHLADQTFYIVRHNITPKSSVKQLDYNPLVQKLPKLSIIFNGVKKRGYMLNDFGYGFGYENSKVKKS